mgnify:CR=1 FL=1
MSELSRKVLEYFEGQGYGINEIVTEIDNLKIDVVRDFLDTVSYTHLPAHET